MTDDRTTLAAHAKVRLQDLSNIRRQRSTHTMIAMLDRMERVQASLRRHNAGQDMAVRMDGKTTIWLWREGYHGLVSKAEADADPTVLDTRYLTIIEESTLLDATP